MYTSYRYINNGFPSLILFAVTGFYCKYTQINQLLHYSAQCTFIRRSLIDVRLSKDGYCWYRRRKLYSGYNMPCYYLISQTGVLVGLSRRRKSFDFPEKMACRYIWRKNIYYKKEIISPKHPLKVCSTFVSVLSYPIDLIGVLDKHYLSGTRKIGLRIWFCWIQYTSKMWTHWVSRLRILISWRKLISILKLEYLDKTRTSITCIYMPLQKTIV